MVTKFEKTLKGNKLSMDIWETKYQHNGETIDEFIERVSSGVPEVKELIANNRFLFGGRILANINTGNKANVSNCATLGYIEDDLDSIMNSAKELAMNFQKEAGVGCNVSKIRPKGAKVGTKGTSDGVLGFINIFNEVAMNISRGGTRRGALYVELSAEHPDVKEFIVAKKNNKGNEGRWLALNMSVGVTDEFMENYERGTTYRKDFVVEATGEVIPHIVNPREIMDLIVDQPHKAFEPGIMFNSRLRENHLFGQSEKMEFMGHNACTEFFGPANTICLLGSINLSKYVINQYTDYARVDVMNLSKDVATAIKALDRALDYSEGKNAVEAQDEMIRRFRSIGLGVMGYADMLIRLGVKYGSNDAIHITEIVAQTIKNSAVKASREQAKEFGQPEGIIEMEKELDAKGIKYTKGLRNMSLLSIAPAGSIGTMLELSTGIEPVFRTSYERTTYSLAEEEITYKVFHKEVERCFHRGGNAEACIDSTQISPSDKAKTLGVWQRYVDLAISNTTNFDGTATTDDIKKFYIEAWKRGVIGTTVYVDGSLQGVLNEEKERCQECGAEISMEGGCKHCPECGWEACSL